MLITSPKIKFFKKIFSYITFISVALSFILYPLDFVFADNGQPDGQDIGAQSERHDDYLREKKQEQLLEEKPSPKIEIPEEKQKPAPISASFTLNQINISGATIYSNKVLAQFYQSYIGKTVSMQDVESIVAKIKAHFQSHGYLTVLVYLPEQEIKDGVVQINILEGRLGKLIVEGNKWFGAEFIKKHFHTQGGEILNAKTLEKDLMRLNQNADLSVNTVLATGEKAGTVNIIAKVTDADPWHAGFTFDNRGTRLIGKHRYIPYINCNNFTGRGDTLFADLSFTSRSDGEAFMYMLPLDTKGTSLGFDYSHFSMKLGKEFKAFDITGDSYTIMPYLSKELFLANWLEVSAQTGLSIRSTKKKQLGNDITDEDLNIPFASLEFKQRDSLGRTFFTPHISCGFDDFLGTTGRDDTLATRSGAGEDFFVYKQELVRIQQMPFATYCMIRSQVQAVSTSLPSSQQIQLGGMRSVRGYPEGDYSADIGWDLSLEWILPKSIKFLWPDSKLVQGKLKPQIEPSVFVDMGWGKLKKTFETNREEKFLLGIGGGATLRFLDNCALTLQWAKAVGDRPTTGAGASTFYISFKIET